MSVDRITSYNVCYTKLLRKRVQRIVQLRLELMLDFEHTDQNLLLIGDWYTAKLYEAIRSELYLDG